jgi:hypothetical protein
MNDGFGCFRRMDLTSSRRTIDGWNVFWPAKSYNDAARAFSMKSPSLATFCWWAKAMAVAWLNVAVDLRTPVSLVWKQARKCSSKLAAA